MKRWLSVLLALVLGTIGMGTAVATSDIVLQDLVELMDRSAFIVTDNPAIYWEATSRDEPAPIGTTVWYKSNTEPVRYVEMTVTGIVRGEEANKIAIEKNPYNADDLTESKEYIVITVNVKMQSTDSSQKLKVSYSSFNVVSKEGLVYNANDYASSFKNDQLEMYAGASGDLEFAMLINIGDEPLLIFANDIWFSLTMPE